MANIQIKRYNGSLTTWEEQYPITKAQNLLNAAGDTNIFDSSDKIKPAFLPNSVFDSLYYYSATGSNSNLYTLADAARTDAGLGGRSPLGYYWVALSTITLTANPTTAQLVGSFYYKTNFLPADNAATGATTDTIETGDWFVITKITGDGSSGDPFVYTFAVVDNTYETATTATTGIVRLSDATTYASLSGNDVITEGVLKTTIDNANFAGASHTHLLSAITDVTATAAELNVLDGIPAGLTATEIGYLDGVTSSIQTQLNGKAATSHTHTLSAITDVTATASELNVLGGITSNTAELNTLDGFTGTVADFNYAKDLRATGVTATEFDYLDGVTSNIQTQLNAKQATITGAATTIVSSNLTASRALVSDGSGKVAVSGVTSTELGYLSGVTSSVQTQLNTLSSRVRVFYDGTPTGMVTDDLWFDAV